MSQLEKTAPVYDENELPHLLNELSFSYMMVYSAQKSLEDLDRSIQELSELVEYLKEENELPE